MSGIVADGRRPRQLAWKVGVVGALGVILTGTALLLHGTFQTDASHLNNLLEDEADDDFDSDTKAAGHSRAQRDKSSASSRTRLNRTVRDLGSILRPRKDLATWVERAASYEEIRHFAWFRKWIARNPRIYLNKELPNLTGAGEWQDCASEREMCHCPSGKVRFGVTETGAWAFSVPKKKPGQVEFSCGHKTFGEDPARGMDKICQCATIICPDGKVGKPERCDSASPNCDAACDREWWNPRRGGPGPRRDLCKTPGITHELLWSCNPSESRVPHRDHPDAEKQDVLERATSEFCSWPEMANQLETYLDCNFLDNYLRFTSERSEWLSEAYVTYIGGKKKPWTHERRTTNTIRSVEAFSTRPLVVVIVDGVYEPPLFWRSFKCLIVYRLHPFPEGLPFNLNKNRAMIIMRVGTGAQLDGDSLVFTGMDTMFAPTRREVTAEYPFPIMPVHYTTPDTKFGRYEGRRSMRWNHAHPTWTHWAIPFMLNVYFWRLAVVTIPGKEIKLWNTTASADGRSLANAKNIKQVLGLEAGQGAGGLEKKAASSQRWMTSDEPMSNVMLWMSGATKAWCKFDLDPALYLRGPRMEARLFGDNKWYPQGLPVIFFSMHNTKNDKDADFLVSLLVFCEQLEKPIDLSCPSDDDLGSLCRTSLDKLEVREKRANQPKQYTSDMCCCVKPRQTKPFLWHGQWYSRAEDVPTRIGNTPRKCLLP